MTQEPSFSYPEDWASPRKGPSPFLLTHYQIQRSLELFPALLPALQQALAAPSRLEVQSDQGTQQHQEHRGDQVDPNLPGTDQKGEWSHKDTFPSQALELLPPTSGWTLTYLCTWRTSWPRGSLNPNTWLTL